MSEDRDRRFTCVGGLECAPAHHDDMQVDQLLDNEPQLRQVLGDVHHIQVLGVGSREVVERHSRRVPGNKREVSIRDRLVNV